MEEVEYVEVIWQNNVAELCGSLADAPRYSHIGKDREYFVFPLEIPRLSGTIDTVNITASKELLCSTLLNASELICVNGEIRSFNNKSGFGSKLVISVFAREITCCNQSEKNSIRLTGTICKPPNLRRTPMGREICDLMLAVNRRYGRSDYIPCITWGQNAITAGSWAVGKEIRISGRLQSRKYIKIQDGVGFEKTAFEVSVISFDDL